MEDDRTFSPFADDAQDTMQILQGLISPAPAQSLVASPPDSPPPTRPGESTPVTGSLATPPSQATPKVDHTPLPENMTQRRRSGLASYFSGEGGGGVFAGSGPQQAQTKPDRSTDANYVKIVSNGQVGYLPKVNLAKAQARDKNLRILP
ncbi:MAG TPA: hypothetical protein VGR96_09715 [Acidobacteriaceae bacterium]|nr:hypothetical protein [Acidobacteriaceae bacterium]